MTRRNAIGGKAIPRPGEARGAECAAPTPRIVLADDQEEILRTVEALLENEFDVLGSVLDGTKALDLALNWCPDVLVLDIFMPGLNGFETAACLQISGCPSKVLFLTVQEDPDFVETAISTGALGYVLKPHIATDLIPAIHSVLEDRVYVSPAITFSWL